MQKKTKKANVKKKVTIRDLKPRKAGAVKGGATRRDADTCWFENRK